MEEINYAYVTQHVSNKMPIAVNWQGEILGPKLLLVMGCVKLGEKNCVHLPSVGEQLITRFHATRGK